MGGRGSIDGADGVADVTSKSKKMQTRARSPLETFHGLWASRAGNGFIPDCGGGGVECSRQGASMPNPHDALI